MSPNTDHNAPESAQPRPAIQPPQDLTLNVRITGRFADELASLGKDLERTPEHILSALVTNLLLEAAAHMTTNPQVGRIDLVDRVVPIRHNILLRPFYGEIL